MRASSLFRRVQSLLFNAYILSWALLGIVFLADFSIRYRLSLSIFYLIPILLMVRSNGIKSAILMAFAAAALWHIADNVSGHPYAFPFIPYWNGFVRLVFFILIPAMYYFWDKESLSARHDILTGLPNRRALIEMAEYEIKRCRRYNRPLSIAFIDLDGFKNINDKFGHHAGDILLGKIADTFQKNIRDTDVLARIGGDEFILLMPETDQNAAVEAVTRELNHLQQTLLHGIYGFVTLSIGIMTSLKNPPPFTEVMKQADQLMYEAKKSGKNQIKTALTEELEEKIFKL